MDLLQLKNLRQAEIEKMINDGRNVYWKHEGYKVIKDCLGQYLIKHDSGNCVGLRSEFNNEAESNSFLEG